MEPGEKLDLNYKILLSINQADESIVITYEYGMIEFANSAFEVNSGYNISELMGKNVSLLNAQVI